jgi:hypothetical protein
MLTESQEAVLSVLKAHGPLPDHALVPLVQHVAGHRISSSGVRTRRNELVALGKARQSKNEIKMPSGRHAHTWEAV